MRIGYLAPVNPERDKKAWSGTYYSIFQQLEKMGFNVEWISYDISSLKIKLAFKRYQLKNGFKVEGIKKNTMIIDGKYIDEFFMAKIYNS